MSGTGSDDPLQEHILETLREMDPDGDGVAGGELVGTASRRIETYNQADVREALNRLARRGDVYWVGESIRCTEAVMEDEGGDQ